MKNYLLKTVLVMAFVAFAGLTYAQTNVTLHVIDTSKTLTMVKAKGTFNEWALADMTMTETADKLANDWAVTVSLADGSYEWGAIEDDGSEWGVWLLGTVDLSNRVFTVAGGVISGDTAFSIPVVDPIDVTVSVDMSFEISKGGFDVTTDSVGLAGPVNEWSYTKLTKGATDSIYSGTFQVGNAFEYKFRKNDQWEGSPNRITYVDGKTNPLVVEKVWYGNISPAKLVSVKCYVVDETEYYEGIQYKGEITGWALEDMYDDGTNGDETAGDHIWTVTLDNVASGASYEWGCVDKDENWLIAGPNAVVEVAIDGSVVSGDTYTIPAWGTVPVTFQVNMNCHINLGVFDIADSCLDVNIDGYPPVEMTHVDTGVFAATVTRFSVGEELAYTYRIGCAFGGDYEEYPGDDKNRTYTVIDGDNNTGVELFQDDVLDNPCAFVGIEEVLTERVQVYPNPVSDEVHINAEFQIQSVDVYNITGQRMMSLQNVNEFGVYLDVNSLNQGIYMIAVNGVDGKKAFSKIIKN